MSSRIVRVTLISMLIGAGLLVALGQTSPTGASTANPFLFPYNQSTSITFNSSDVWQAWTGWKATNITANNAGGGGRLRVLGGVNTSSSVSEGQGYGILFASLFDDQTTLDGLWLFTRDYLDSYGLMNWYIGNPGQILGTGAATDGDEDMALGMVNACLKVQKGAWPASPNGLNYCQTATNLINAIYRYEVDHPGSEPPAGLSNDPGNELIPGDQWNLQSQYPQGIVNLSYFSPGYYTVFGKFTNQQSAWDAVNTRNYQIANLAQGKSGNCSKLISNWDTYNGDPQSVSWQAGSYMYWGWDAARFAWRVAVDRAWYNSTNARATTNAIGGFFSSVGIGNVQAEYRLDGTSVDNYSSPFFIANAAAAIWAAPNPTAVNCGAATGTLKSTPQQAYDLLKGMADNSYYAGAWRLFGMLLLTGNFPNFYEMANGVVPPPTATPTPSASTQKPYPNANQPALIPGIVQAENYDTGGEGVAYYDTTAGNSGNQYRSDDVDIESTTDTGGGYDVGWIANGEWLEYTVNVTGGTYDIEARVASADSNPGDLRVLLNGVPLGVFNVPGTGGWQNWQTLKLTNVSAAGGNNQILRLEVVNGGLFNVNWIKFTASSPAATPTPIAPTPTSPAPSGSCQVVYTITGQWTDGFTADVTIKNTSTTAIKGWTLAWTFGGNQKITNIWNAVATQANQSVSASDAGWNANLAASGTAEFGFQAAYTGTNAKPTTFSLNGRACTTP